MPNPHDLLPKYVNYRIEGGAGNMGDSLVNGVLPNQTLVVADVWLGEPRTGGGRSHWVNTNQPWTFVFLKYYPGYVTVAPLNRPVLTGPMSGCYLCRYRGGGGGEYVAHIGTANVETDALSIKAKQSWLNFVARPGVTAVVGGSPADYFSVDELQAYSDPVAGVPIICGYFDGAMSYAIALGRVGRAPAGLALLKVCSIKTMTMQPWSAIAAMRRFRL